MLLDLHKMNYLIEVPKTLPKLKHIHFNATVCYLYPLTNRKKNNMDFVYFLVYSNKFLIHLIRVQNTWRIGIFKRSFVGVFVSICRCKWMRWTPIQMWCQCILQQYNWVIQLYMWLWFCWKWKIMQRFVTGQK